MAMPKLVWTNPPDKTQVTVINGAKRTELIVGTKLTFNRIPFAYPARIDTFTESPRTGEPTGINYTLVNKEREMKSGMLDINQNRDHFADLAIQAGGSRKTRRNRKQRQSRQYRKSRKN